MADEAREMLEAAHRERQHSNSLGFHSQGEDHAEALALLRQLRDGAALASKLGRVLRGKSEIGYDITRIKDDQVLRILRNATDLVDEAFRRSRA